MSQFDIIRCSW